MAWSGRLELSGSRRATCDMPGKAAPVRAHKDITGARRSRLYPFPCSEKTSVHGRRLPPGWNNRCNFLADNYCNSPFDSVILFHPATQLQKWVSRLALESPWQPICSVRRKRMMSPCIIADRMVAPCDRCGCPASPVHMPRWEDGIYCSECCPACNNKKVDQLEQGAR